MIFDNFPGSNLAFLKTCCIMTCVRNIQCLNLFLFGREDALFPD